MRYVRPVLKGNDWFSWTKAVAADVRSRHNGTCRVTVTPLTPIRGLGLPNCYAGNFLREILGCLYIGTHTKLEERVGRKGCVRSEMRNSYLQPRLGGRAFDYTSTCVPLRSHRLNTKDSSVTKVRINSRSYWCSAPVGEQKSHTRPRGFVRYGNGKRQQECRKNSIM